MSISEKLVTIAENQQRVFDAGRNSGGGGSYDDGWNEGYNEGYDSGYGDGYDSGYYDGQDIGYGEGQQSEYDRFWDAFQQNGRRGGYQYAFAGTGEKDAWNDETFKPKYDMILGEGYTGSQMFWWCPASNIAETLEKQGVRLDTTRCGSMTQMFQSAFTKRVPELNCTHAMDYGNGLEYTFVNSLIETIDKLIVTEALTYYAAFKNCYYLKNITFEGAIGQNIDFADSTQLSKESIENIIEHLSATASGKTLTLSSTAVTNAFGSTTASEWTSLVNSRSNWTISLV